MKVTHPRYVLAVLLSLGCLVFGQLVLKNDLDSILASYRNVSTYYNLLKAHPDALFGFPDTIGVTMIVPDNEAFEKIDWDSKNKTMVTEILRYHIFPGMVSVGTTEEGTPIFSRTLLDGTRVILNRQNGDEVVFTSGADRRSMLLEGDIEFSDGLIQIVDTVMVPPPGLVPICREYNPTLAAFLGALYQTNLTGEILASKNITIFAPNNAAFQRTSGALSALSPSELLDVMKFHIVPAVVYSNDLVNGTSWRTLAGKNITVTVAGNNRYIASSQILDPDILIDFGVVHMLGNVLNPAQSDARPTPSMMVQPPAFALVGSTSTGNRVPVPFTSALPCTADCPPPTHAAAQSTSVRLPIDNSVAGGLVAECTGLMGAMGVGVLGVGMLGAAGML
ncbi:hypothetical protein N8I77_010072 [Diaporthe amygdali]|uniref:FAS1 domain-containing protein n=1 Tax=Phomopsis amygdali TaxID=1214568 RepID=A0AAD9S6D8_PHOAM|nr:hypothetical protein N8I77_010072 [Diaporthe amygdali]